MARTGEMAWPPEPGEVYAVGHRLYVTCEQCGKTVQANKPIVGSLHVCEAPDDGYLEYMNYWDD